MADSGLACPLPLSHDECIVLAHGGGGTLTARLLERVFLPAFRNERLAPLGDGAILPFGGERLALTTDSFVVRPAFFPGGDIGSLSVHGSVNDLAMCGAEPLGLSAGFVLEEGFPIADLERVARSMAAACAEVGVSLVTGDTKVVDHGKGDGIYINTSAVGRVRPDTDLGPDRARPGDAILVSGPVGEHGIAVMAAREGLEFETTLISDSAHVLPLVRALIDVVPNVHCLRDPTRGGLATALCELALSSGVGIVLDEGTIPVREEVQAACALLGFDPLYVACEGRFLAIVPEREAERGLEALRDLSAGKGAARIGRVRREDAGRVVMKTTIGTHRLIERLSGEQLPRIC